MARHRAVLISVTLCIIALLAINGYTAFNLSSLPFTPRFVDAHTAVVEPISAAPLPEGLRAGDRIDIPSLDQSARAALFAGGAQDSNMTRGVTYQFAIRRGTTNTMVPVTTGIQSIAPVKRLFISWTWVYLEITLAIVTLLALWKGRDRTARFLVLWGIAYLIGDTLIRVPLSGFALYEANIIEYLLFFVGRFALYGVAETLAGDSLSANVRITLRIGFALTLLAGITVVLGGAWLLVYRGSAVWIDPALTWLITAPYLVTAAALFIAQYRASSAQKIRIQWMLWSLVPFIVGVLARDISVLGFVGTLALNSVGISVGLSGFLYAILRHRMVDVSVVIDKTLVYGATTTLVVGVIAAVNSLALRATLGEGASLLLQVAVPLALGIVLGKVRTYMDRLVERVFFRKKYLAEKALKSFARHCGHIENVQRLLDSAVAEIRRHTRSPALALYEITDQGYTRVRQAGDVTYPQHLDNDDPAVVAARAERKAVELSDFTSSMGTDGCVIPITVLGRLRGVLVCANRPGEHYATDEKQLLTRVVRDVGAAWRILRARDNEEFVRAVARGTLDPASAQTRAQTLEAAWMGA
ncbi:MAG TPA: GAF domain-containing protein [Gammaproteobacteria bacterium]|nr:GAF domain-containing protein [Gammaproteobacteria bacterium]